MRTLTHILGTVLTTSIVFLWVCGRFADMRPAVDAQAASLVGSGPYTPSARRPPPGSRGPRYSVEEIKDARPNECGARLDIRWVAPGVFRTGVYVRDRRGPAPPGLQGRRFQSLPGYQGVYALATNHHGQVVGYCESIGRGAWTRVQARALLWQRGRVRALETLPGYQITHAVALNNRGMIVGDATVDSFPGSMDDPGHAVCWIGGKVRDLGTGWALAVNNAGDIVGDSGTGPAVLYHVAHALLWTHSCRYDLNGCIPPHSGWLLSQAAHIDGRGRITGYGTFHGQPRMFRLTPQETKP